MEELFKQLLKEVEKGTVGMAVLSTRQKDGKSAQEILSDWDEEYDPNSEACKQCKVTELCKIVTKIKKLRSKTDGKVQPSEKKSVDKEYKDLYGEFAEAGGWLGDILFTLVKKNADYGDAFKNITKEDKTYPCNQILTKAYRIKSLITKADRPNYESVEDSLKDLVGYCILTYKALKDGTLKL